MISNRYHVRSCFDVLSRHCGILKAQTNATRSLHESSSTSKLAHWCSSRLGCSRVMGSKVSGLVKPVVKTLPKPIFAQSLSHQWSKEREKALIECIDALTMNEYQNTNETTSKPIYDFRNVIELIVEFIPHFVCERSLVSILFYSFVFLVSILFVCSIQ